MPVGSSPSRAVCKETTRLLTINADARVLGATLMKGQQVSYPLTPDRNAYLAPSKGVVVVNGQRVAAGDGVAATAEDGLVIVADEDSEFILVDAA